MVLLIIPLGLAVMFGWIIGNIRQAIVMIIPFMMLRKFSGGFHAKTPLQCMTISSFLLFLCIKIIFELSCNWKLLIVTAIMGGSLIIFSPVEAGLQIPCLIKQLTLVKNGRKILFRL